MSDIAVFSKLIFRLRYVGAADPAATEGKRTTVSDCVGGDRKLEEGATITCSSSAADVSTPHKPSSWITNIIRYYSRRRGDDERRSHMGPQSQNKPWKSTCQEVGSAPRGQGQSECSNVEGPQSNLQGSAGSRHNVHLCPTLRGM